jgi:hypothetical protein
VWCVLPPTQHLNPLRMLSQKSLDQVNLLLTALETGKAKIKALLDSVSGKWSFSSKMATSCCVPKWWKGQDSSLGPLF